MHILLSFVGFHDPYSKALISGEERPGPILTVVRERRFDRVILFSTPRTADHTRSTAQAIAGQIDTLPVEIIDLTLEDPTDYKSILSSLRQHCANILDRFPGVQLHISTASGTPQMHACWLLLVASGETPGRLLHTRPPEFVSDKKPVVSEIDPTTIPFPEMRPARLAFGEEHSGDVDIHDQIPAIDTVLEEVGLVAEHTIMRLAVDRAATAAPFAAPILILGETGTGKELFAMLVHRLSGRQQDRFVPLNCASIPSDLVESTLFGHKRGAFTGAVTDLKGKFEIADRGTLFLDEIGELPLNAQAKLLRVLEDSYIEPVGSNQRRLVDVRIVAATNRDLVEEIRAGRFREDLYYRLRGADIILPPLRERRSEIPRLSLHILEMINKTIAKPRQFSTEALTKLQSHSWPGNVRDLRAVIQRAVMFSRGKTVLDGSDIVFDGNQGTDIFSYLPEPKDGFRLNEFLSDIRTALFRRALAAANNNQSKAARILGVTPQAVSNFIKEPAERDTTSEI